MNDIRDVIDVINHIQMPEQEVCKFSEFAYELLFTVARAHSWHLQTQSYAQHIALGEFYDGLQDLADVVIEAHIGIKGPLQPSCIEFKFDAYTNAVQAITELHEKTTALLCTFEGEATITVTLEEILSLCATTIYKLKNLH